MESKEKMRKETPKWVIMLLIISALILITLVIINCIKIKDAVGDLDDDLNNSIKTSEGIKESWQEMGETFREE